VGAELFHADRWTDRHDEAIVAFRNFAKEPKMVQKRMWLLIKGEYDMLVLHTTTL